mmetsp:Transcript_61784/g.172565  ORF Transcript_61784/g.172565 Transcript_61784/m.172565 type:complete len:305 (+) Transcript_61784:287-1201(+)
MRHRLRNLVVETFLGFHRVLQNLPSCSLRSFRRSQAVLGAIEACLRRIVGCPGIFDNRNAGVLFRSRVLECGVELNQLCRHHGVQIVDHLCVELGPFRWLLAQRHLQGIQEGRIFQKRPQCRFELGRLVRGRRDQLHRPNELIHDGRKARLILFQGHDRFVASLLLFFFFPENLGCLSVLHIGRNDLCLKLGNLRRFPGNVPRGSVDNRLPGHFHLVPGHDGAARLVDIFLHEGFDFREGLFDHAHNFRLVRVTLVCIRGKAIWRGVFECFQDVRGEAPTWFQCGDNLFDLALRLAALPLRRAS